MDTFNHYIIQTLWKLEQTELINQAERKRQLAELKEQRRQDRQIHSHVLPQTAQPVLAKEVLECN